MRAPRGLHARDLRGSLAAYVAVLLLDRPRGAALAPRRACSATWPSSAPAACSWSAGPPPHPEERGLDPRRSRSAPRRSTWSATSSTWSRPATGAVPLPVRRRRRLPRRLPVPARRAAAGAARAPARRAADRRARRAQRHAGRRRGRDLGDRPADRRGLGRQPHRRDDRWPTRSARWSVAADAGRASGMVGARQGPRLPGLGRRACWSSASATSSTPTGWPSTTTAVGTWLDALWPVGHGPDGAWAPPACGPPSPRRLPGARVAGRRRGWPRSARSSCWPSRRRWRDNPLPDACSPLLALAHLRGPAGAGVPAAARAGRRTRAGAHRRAHRCGEPTGAVRRARRGCSSGRGTAGGEAVTASRWR